VLIICLLSRLKKIWSCLTINFYYALLKKIEKFKFFCQNKIYFEISILLFYKQKKIDKKNKKYRSINKKISWEKNDITFFVTIAMQENKNKKYLYFFFIIILFEPSLSMEKKFLKYHRRFFTYKCICNTYIEYWNQIEIC